MKKSILFICFFIITNYSFAQYGGFVAGVEFSKPIFSANHSSLPGLMGGFFYHGQIEKNIVDYQLEFTINHYYSFNTHKYPYYENQVFQDNMIEEREFNYISAELTALFEFPEMFAKSYPNFYLGFSAGYCIDEEHKSKIVRFVPELDPIITDFEPSPFPVALSLNTGFSYTVKSFTFDLRYKLTEIILDEENFMNSFYFIIRLHLRD
jgi:hypothetical protein